MAAPSGITWGAVVKGNSENPNGRQDRIGIYTKVSNTNSETTVNVQVWFWTIYSCSDGLANKLYYDVGTGVTSASSVAASNITINHTVSSGSGWSTSNQTKLLDKTYKYSREKSAKTYKIFAKFSGIDMMSGPASHNVSFTVPALPSYTVAFNANGGSNAPASQKKWYGETLPLTSSEPTRTGYTFQGWALTDSEADAGKWYYAAGGSCGKNENLTLYAVWKIITYTITYNANGGTGAPGSQTKTYGVALALSSTEPTKANYTFLGWATSASATTAAYSAGGTYSSNSAATLYAVWKLAYKKPRITNFSVFRCDENGNESDSGQYALISFDWACDKSNPSILIECVDGSGDRNQVEFTESGTSGAILNNVAFGDLTIESTYTIRVTVKDGTSDSEKNSVSRTLPGMKFTVDYLAGGNGVAFGKPAEKPDNVEFAWNALFNNQLRICGRDLSGNSVEAFQPINENGNTVIGWGNYSAKTGNTNIYGHDINLAISNADSSAQFRPYFRKGDYVTDDKKTGNITIRTTGYITNNKQDIYFLIPLALPIIGNPTVTVTSGTGFRLRQNNAYTHGSTANTNVVPIRYTVTKLPYVGIRVTASFEDTTNAINNSPIGIEWNGSISFT